MLIKNISKIAPFFLLFILLIPSTSFGYFTTNQTAQNITPSSALYTIDFSFGFANRDVYIPVMTQRGLSFADKQTTNTLGYSFTTPEGTNNPDGISVGLVLGSFPIEDGMYRVPAGTRGDFKLVVILTRESTAAEETYALQVDKLPFPVSYSDGREDYFELNPSELQNYATDGINMNSVIAPITPALSTTISSPSMTIAPNGK